MITHICVRCNRRVDELVFLLSCPEGLGLQLGVCADCYPDFKSWALSLVNELHRRENYGLQKELVSSEKQKTV